MRMPYDGSFSTVGDILGNMAQLVILLCWFKCLRPVDYDFLSKFSAGKIHTVGPKLDRNHSFLSAMTVAFFYEHGKY